MTAVQRNSDLRTSGLSDVEIARLVSAGELERIRRGAFVPSALAPHSTRERHRLLIAGSVPGLHTDAVISHSSAAVLHGLPVDKRVLGRVTVTRSRSYGGRSDPLVHVYVAPFGPDEVTMIDGHPVTTLERTVVDIARTVGLDAGIMAADAALRCGAEREALADAVDRARRRPGVRRARRVAQLADPRAESAGESVSRLRIVQHGLPVPEPQLEILSPSGRLVARSDFGWVEHATLGEFDGQVKYGVLATDGATEAVFKEKLREDEVRDLCWQVVRWTWFDLGRFDSVADRLRRAYARGRPNQLRGRWRAHLAYRNPTSHRP